MAFFGWFPESTPMVSIDEAFVVKEGEKWVVPWGWISVKFWFMGNKILEITGENKLRPQPGPIHRC